MVIAIHIRLRFVTKAKARWRVDGWRWRSIEQAAQHVEHMLLGGCTASERLLDRSAYHLFVVMEHQRQNLDHLTVTAEAFEQHGPQPAKRLWQLSEWRTVAKRARLFVESHRDSGASCKLYALADHGRAR